jgi:hypothetical protein
MEAIITTLMRLDAAQRQMSLFSLLSRKETAMEFLYDDPTGDVGIGLDATESAQWLEGDERQSALRQRIMAELVKRSLHGTIVVRLEDGTIAATASDAEPSP